MKIQTKEGARYEGSAVEIVQAMKSDSWWYSDPKVEYMNGIAERMELQTGEPMTYTDPASFLRELSQREMLTID